MRRSPPPWLPVFAAALAVRLFYLFESSDSPAFLTPLVDAETYDRLARALASGTAPGPELFWQPVLYPLLLGAAYALSGGSILAAKLLQAGIGAATSALTCVLGTAVYERRVGTLAGWITALYGPLVFYDGELVATGLACLWSVLLLSGSLAALRGAGRRTCLAVGVCGGLASITRPSFVPFAVLLLAALPWVLARRGVAPATVAVRGACVAAGLAIVLVPAALARGAYAGRVSFLPASTGINLWLGNNPDSDRTVALRPGWEWSELTRMPERYGVERKSETSAFFRGLTLDWMREHPGGFAAGLLRKSVQIASPRELARNVDIYLFRRWSWTLWLSVWKIGPFGFPFGALLPLAVCGALVAGRSRGRPGGDAVLGPALLVAFVLCYAATIVAVFVSGRYRLPLVPPLAVLAAGGLVELGRAWHGARRRRALGLTAAAAACAVAFSLAGPFPQERVDYERELLYLLGSAARRAGELDRAAELLEAALERGPDDSDTHDQLGNVWVERRRYDLALRHYALAVQAAPRNALARANYARALLSTGRAEEAAREFAEALRLRPRNAELHRLHGRALLAQGDAGGAIEAVGEALRLDRGNRAAQRDLERARAAARGDGVVPAPPP